jgi:hypothetical protein
MQRIERGDHASEGRDGVGCAVRVGDMALHARNLDPHVDRTAPSYFDGVSEAVDRGWLADQDHVRPYLPFVQPVDDPRRAVSGEPFLVSGDHQGEGAFAGFEAGESRDISGDRALRCHWRHGRSGRR